MRKNVFSLVFASEAKQNWNEAKTKQKRTETKRNKKILEAKQSENIHSINYALIRSEKFKAKRSGKKICAWACETHPKRISFLFVSLWSEKFFFAEPAHPTLLLSNVRVHSSR
jgi:hypothetical protein